MSSTRAQTGATGTQMQDTSMPYDKLVFFQEQLGLTEEEMERLDPYRSLFIAKKHEFASFLYNHFYQITRTRIILQHERAPGSLKEIWAYWFEAFFSAGWDKSFYGFLWRSGLRHVEVNLDQRFVNLGYCILRQYCHQIVSAEIPVASRGGVLLVIDKMLDLCLLVETNAYMVAASYCDREVMQGISHQIRNPITVIGGNARRLQKKSAADTETYKVLENIIQESKRLERLVVDIAAYIEMFQTEPKYSMASLEGLVAGALDRLSGKKTGDLKIEMDLDPAFPDVHGDPNDLETMFYYILENSIEALPADDPRIVISSRVKSYTSQFLEVVIFNSGAPPKAEDVNHFFAPFSSSKPTGTGFGLPIARLAAKKSLASLALVPVPGKGAKCIVNLPLPG